MAKTEMARAPETAVGRPRDIFSTMRSEMDRMFERFEHGLPRFPHLFRGDKGSVMVPELNALYSFASVHHLVSTVTARLRPGLDACGRPSPSHCFAMGPSLSP